MNINYQDPTVLSRIVSIVSARYPDLRIGSFEGVINWEDSRGPLVKTSNGKMLISKVAIEDVDHHHKIPEYGKFMASTFVVG